MALEITGKVEKKEEGNTKGTPKKPHRVTLLTPDGQRSFSLFNDSEFSKFKVGQYLHITYTEKENPNGGYPMKNLTGVVKISDEPLESLQQTRDKQGQLGTKPLAFGYEDPPGKRRAIHRATALDKAVRFVNGIGGPDSEAMSFMEIRSYTLEVADQFFEWLNRPEPPPGICEKHETDWKISPRDGRKFHSWDDGFCIDGISRLVNAQGEMI